MGGCDEVRFVRMGIFAGLIVTMATAALLTVALVGAQAEDPLQGEIIATGVNPFDPPPDEAVEWLVFNPDTGHQDEFFALPGKPNPDGLTVRDRLDVDDATWSLPTTALTGTCTALFWAIPTPIRSAGTASCITLRQWRRSCVPVLRSLSKAPTALTFW